VSSAAYLVLASLGAGLVVVALALLGSTGPQGIPERSGFWKRARAVFAADVGPLNFDFSKSFASNLTVLGAILTAVLGAKLLPEQSGTTGKDVVMSQNGYTSLSLLFAILVIVGPFIYVALRTGVRLGTDGGAVGNGRGFAFLLATLLTVWGAIGQMATVGLIFYEGKRAHTILRSVVFPVWLVIGCTLVLIAYYSIKVMIVYIERSTATVAKSGAPARGYARVEPPAVSPQRPAGWTAL
jgi:hypothetical protein